MNKTLPGGVQVLGLLWLALSIKMITADAASNIGAPADFAEGMHVTPAGDTAVQYFEVPYSVYEGITREDRSDIAVFDAGGRPVPWMIRQAQAVSRTEATHDLPMFPLYTADNKTLKDLSLKIERKADGTLVGIQAVGSSQSTTSPQKIAYLFDLQPVGENVDGRLGKLVFDWSNPATDAIWHVNLEGSGDLENWETLAFGAVLARLNYAGQTLFRNTVTVLPFADIKYLRMSWPVGQTPPDLTKVTAKFQNRKTNAEWRFRSFKLIPVEGVDDKATMGGGLPPSLAVGYTFSTGGFVPVEKLLFELPKGNSLYKGKLYSRVDERRDWTLRGEFLQYRLRTQDALLVNDEQAIPLTTDPQWLIAFDEPRMGGDVQPSGLRIGWKAEYLHFLALGETPYTLAYGNASADFSAYASDTLKQLSAQQDARGQAAKLSEPFMLGGDQKRLPPKKPLPWRTFLLWFVLLAGVAVMTWMVLNLYRQMNSD